MAFFFLLALVGAVGASNSLGADGMGGQTNVFAARARQAYLIGRERHEREPTNSVAGWQFGRACFDWAEFSTNDTQRAEVAMQGIAASQEAVRVVPSLAAGHYYLGMNLGQLARTKTFGALKLVNEMERSFKIARELDATLDYAGPDRCLGLLYLDAPGWPASIGSRKKAREHLLRAVEVAPDYPENRLNLVEALLRWGDKKSVHPEAKALSTLMPKARTTLTGEVWAASWADWDRRWGAIRDKTGVQEPSHE